MGHIIGAVAAPSAAAATAHSAPETAVIASSVLFRGLPPDAVLNLALAGALKRIPKGAAAFEQGTPAERLFVVVRGRLKATQSTADGHQMTARFLNPGDLFGCVALMAAGNYPVSASAETDAIVASWSSATMLRVAHQYPQIALNALQYVGKQLRDTQARLQEAMTERTEQRIAHALLRLLSQSGRKTAEGIEIDFPISRQDIAEIAGSRLFTVSRTLSKWQVDGIVKSGRRRITIVAPHRLTMIAERPARERP